jgi:aspartate racemase
MKTVGIIGGMGPEATNQLVLKIIGKFLATGQKNRPDILVSFIPVDLDIESNLIRNNEVGNFPELLVEAAKKLENGGADFIILACNTVHIFIDILRKSVNIPVLSVVEEVNGLAKIDNLGIIGTTTTVKTLFGLETLKNQDEVDQKIVDLAKGERDDAFFIKVVDEMSKQRKKKCLLACSDLQSINFTNSIELIDTMDILADKAVNCLLNRL